MRLDQTYSNLSPSKGIILAFCLRDGQKKSALRRVCDALNLTLREVPEMHFTLPLGYLAAPEQFSGKAPAVPGAVQGSPAIGQGPISVNEEMIVLCHLTEETLDRFLQESRALHCSISLKAVLTETNASWNASMLQGMLKEERAAILKQLQQKR